MIDSADVIKPTVRSRLFGDIQFPNAEVFDEWTRTQLEFWRTHVPRDAINPALATAVRGVGDHVRAWEAVGSNVERALNPDPSHGTDNALLTNAATDIAKKLDARSLILSTSVVGLKLEALLERNPEEFAIAVCLYTGNNLGRILLENQGVTPWRALPTIIEQFSEHADTEAKISSSLKSVSVAESTVRTIENTLREQLTEAQKYITTEEENRRASLDTLFAEFRASIAQTIQASEKRCSDLEEHYRRQQALKAPREYWQGRRTAHDIYAAIWGASAVVLIVAVLWGMSHDWFQAFAVARDKLKPIEAGKAIAWTAALPEIALIAVSAFMLLWALRFFVRQVAQHLSRAEEAAQRVTMVKTFLALAEYKREDLPSLITEADRALMIQALFRASSINSPEDAPPSHWIEDVVRRFTDASKAGK